MKLAYNFLFLHFPRLSFVTVLNQINKISSVVLPHFSITVFFFKFAKIHLYNHLSLVSIREKGDFGLHFKFLVIVLFVLFFFSHWFWFFILFMKISHLIYIFKLCVYGRNYHIKSKIPSLHCYLPSLVLYSCFFSVFILTYNNRDLCTYNSFQRILRFLTVSIVSWISISLLFF